MWHSAYSDRAGRDNINTAHYFDPSASERYLETIPEVESVKSKRSDGSPTSVKMTSFVLHATTEAEPIVDRGNSYDASRLTTQTAPYRNTAWSQGSGLAPNDYNYSSYDRRESYPDISPPSTPRKSWGTRSLEEPVSPIEPMPPLSARVIARAPLPEQNHKSQIPRKVVPAISRIANQDATKWDKYSGEPTTHASGIAGAVRPGSTPLEQQYPQLKEKTKLILAGLRERNKLDRPADEISPTDPAPADHTVKLQTIPRKEPWKGASGRTALIDPVEDTPDARQGPVQPPPRTVTRMTPLNSNPPTPDRLHAIESPSATESPHRSIHEASSLESIKPVAPLKISTTKARVPSPPQIVTTGPESTSPSPSPPPPLDDQKTLQSPFNSPHLQNGSEEPYATSVARTESPQNDPSPATPRTPTPAEEYHSLHSKPSEPQIAEDSEAIHDPAHPEISRFSWTTYATSVTDSPTSAWRSEVSAPPVPPIPPITSMPPIRKRPLAAKYNSKLYEDAEAARSKGSIVIRKPLPAKTADKGRAASDTEEERGHKPNLSRSKTLPRVPPELEAGDKISTLEAQLSSLGRRKHNLGRILARVQDDLRQNQLKYDIYKRRQVQGTIDDYQGELRDIANEEHDVGLRLHRAKKKRDKADEWEMPTGLWIKRVTS